ncbi:MAG: tRNA pseudouridine(38-40) synthase TruA [Bacteroidota bacterium]
MFSKRYFYLIEIQYLGFRYHGWQKQPDLLTVEHMMSRTLAYVLGHKHFKLLASGRTDAKVSVNQGFVELFLDDEPLNLETFFPEFNANLPQDIRALRMKEVDKSFNIIEAPSEKEYLYLFSFGTKNHPFTAPFMTGIIAELDIAVMQQAAKLFEGTHDFINYTYKPNPETKTIATISKAEIAINDVYEANFFPEKSFVFRVCGKGFKRHQVRLMMGALFDLGEGKVDLNFIEDTLKPGHLVKLERIAPASGLQLNRVDIK